jgi:hypothetical protein
VKFLRTYSLALECGPFDDKGDATRNLTIPSTEYAETHQGEVPPLTIEFDIRREYLASAQTATFTILNLGEETRNQIYKDRYDTAKYAALQFRAGYLSQQGIKPLLFNGTIRWAYSERQGRDYRTTIEAFDGGFAMANSFTSRTVYAGQTLEETLKALNQDMVGLSATPPGVWPKQKPDPIIGRFPQTNLRGNVLHGPTWKVLLDNLPAGAHATIDNGQLKVLNFDEYMQFGLIPVLNSETGLLDTPRRSGATIVCRMLFEPRLTIGQSVLLESASNTIYNGEKKVIGFRHHGTISPSGSGECYTEVALWQGTAALNPVIGTPIK